MNADAPNDSPPITSVSSATWDFLAHDIPVAFFGLTSLAIIVSLAGLFWFNEAAVPIAVFIAYTFWLQRLKSRVQAKFMEQFAARNGLDYHPIGLPRVQTGHLLTRGHDAKTTSLISGTLGSLEYQLFLFTTIIASGESQSTLKYTVMEVSLGTNAPNLYATSLQTGTTSAFWQRNLNTQVTETHTANTLKLEGNFDQYYHIALDAGEEIEALQIFEPTLMARLIDTPYRYDFELLDQTLFIYAPQYVSSQAELDSFYKFAKVISQSIHRKVSTMRVPDTVAAPQTTRSSNINYNTGTIITVILLTVGMFGLLLAFLTSSSTGSSPELRTQAGISGVILMIGCVSLVFTQAFRR